MRRASLIVLALALLGGCAIIPTDGPVQVGDAHTAPDGRVFPVQPPGQGDEPADIVEGFIESMPAGVEGDYSAALQYMSAEAREAWDPSAGVTIYGSEAFTPVWDEATGTITYILPIVAYVDERGVLTEAEPGTRESVAFELSGGPTTWRIASLEDGIVMSEANFSALYRQVSLMWASKDLSVLVPDVRWLADHNVATRAAEEMVAGPAPWLADAVASGFSPIAELAVASVPVENGVASVALTADSVSTTGARALAFAEMNATLVGLPNVSSVQVSVGGLPIGGEGGPTLRPAPVRLGAALAFVDGRLGSWDGESFSFPLGAARLPAGSQSPALSYDGRIAAYLVGGGRQLRTEAAPAALLVPSQGSPTPVPITSDVVFEGGSLVPPSFDRHGWLWTGEQHNSGALVAVGPDGPMEIPVSWLAGRQVAHVRVSADGARVAVLSREGAVWYLSVAGVVRTDSGQPVSIGAFVSVGVDIPEPADLVWLNDTEVAVLESAPSGWVPELTIVTIAGRTSVLSTVPEAVGVTARNGVGSLAILTSDGAVYVRSNTTWSRVVGTVPVTGLEFVG